MRRSVVAALAAAVGLAVTGGAQADTFTVLAGDVTLAGFGGWNSYSSYDYTDRSYLLPDGQPYLAYIYTERPIYRPGQAVNFKAILRKDDDVRYSLPAEGTPVKVRVLDARENAIENMELTTNRFGTVNSAFTISEGAMLGHYQIEVEVNGVTTSQTFQVEDYRKPDYQVKLTSLQPEKQNKFVRGEEMQVQIDASRLVVSTTTPTKPYSRVGSCAGRTSSGI